MLMNMLDQPTITALGFKYNERLTAMLEMAPLNTECMNTGDIPEARAFEGILNCFSSFYLIYLFNLIKLSIYRLIPNLIICVFLYSEKPIWTNEVCVNVRSSNSSRLQHVENTGMIIILFAALTPTLAKKLGRCLV